MIKFTGLLVKYRTQDLLQQMIQIGLFTPKADSSLVILIGDKMIFIVPPINRENDQP